MGTGDEMLSGVAGRVAAGVTAGACVGDEAVGNSVAGLAGVADADSGTTGVVGAARGLKRLQARVKNKSRGRNLWRMVEKIDFRMSGIRFANCQPDHRIYRWSIVSNNTSKIGFMP